jgi:hypothetical protein
MNLLHLLLASSTLALLSACTSPVDSPPGNDPQPTGDDPAPTTSPGNTMTLQAPQGWTLGALAAASAGDEGAIAYAESDGGDADGVVKTLLKLQRLDVTGAARGAAVELGSVSSVYRPTLTLAAGGSDYLACWEIQSQITCSTVPVSAGPAAAALSAVGVNPSLAYGSGAWALAYGVPGHLAVQRVAGDGSATGALALFDATGDTPPMALLAATKEGFVLAGGDDDMRVYRLSGALAPEGDPVDLGASFWMRAALAASETSVAVSVSKPYGSRLFVLNQDSAITSTHELSGGYKEGMNVALAANGATFEMLSADDEEGINYNAVAGEKVTASETALKADHGRYTDGALALLRVHGELLLAATQGWLGQELIVTRVHQP